MTKKATMPIYNKKPKQNLLWNQKAYDLETWSATSGAHTKFVQMMTLGWPWRILRQGHIWSLVVLYGKKGKSMTFSETIVAYDIKVRRCS